MPEPRGPDQNGKSAAPRSAEVRTRNVAEMLAPWLALAALWFLFELPGALRSAVPDLKALRFSLELPLLLTAWGVLEARQAGRFARIVLGAAAACLLALQLDHWICLLLLHEEPLLYDQWFMARHLAVLIGDLMSWQTGLVLLGVAIVSWLATKLTRRLLARARGLFTPERRWQTAKVAACVWCVLIAGEWSLRSLSSPPLRWWTPALARNLAESRAVYLGIQTKLKRSPYAAHDALSLAERPDVLLFIVESYGRLLSAEPTTAAAHRMLLAELERELTGAGWHAASAFSTAPVSGGRSWLAEGTMLMGTPIHYEAVFQHLVSQRPRNLVGFLNRQGYETVLLAPADRNRPGAHVVNRYGFQQILSYEELGYAGPAIGWGIVPDQFSLAVAERRVLQARTRPVFLDFHMVSSHAPWQQVPELSDEEVERAAGAPRARKESSGTRAVLRGLGRYNRDAVPRYAYMERFDASMREGYQATITYDLRLIARYLARRSEDALVVVIGDHQPPVIARADHSFDTPMHVLSRTPRRLEPLLRNGFVKGLALAATAPPALAHAGVYSLLVHTLQAGGCAEQALPRVLAQGDALLAQER